MTILAEILKQKEQEVSVLKQQPMNNTSMNTQYIPSITQTFAHTNHMNIIAEIKRASPSKGDIGLDIDPVQQAKLYASCGAGAISVLTDETFFKGSMDDLRAVRKSVDLPLLCKDFMIDEVQIDLAKASGASIILLIAAAMSPERLETLFNYAKEQQLDVLCEVNDKEEMAAALDLGADVIGINNRDLTTFTVDLENTGRLASMVANPDTIIISESGIASRKDAREAAYNGANAVLVGETLMRAEDVSGMFRDLQVPLPKGRESNAR